MNQLIKQDIEEFVRSFELSAQLGHTIFLITGGTGLIGSTLIHCLLALNRNIRIVAPVRCKAKAQDMYESEEHTHIHFIECDLSSFDYSEIGEVDFIVHCAAPTSSKFFVEKPVETFNTIVNCTQVLLEYVRRFPVKGFVYLSSLEVYGTILDDLNFLTEEVQGYLDPMATRSSYPMAKRAAENLCALYATEYNLNIMVARLTQTTGVNVSSTDNRVITQFCRLASQGQNIILHTQGRAARPYCYTTDCVSAILYILLKGEKGNAYNVANADTYISARGLAELLRDNFNPNISVEFRLNDNMGYAPETKLRLSTAKLQELGWSPQNDLKTILSKLISTYK